MRTTALSLSGLALVLFACSSEAPTASTKSPTSSQNPNGGDDKTPAKPGSKASDTSSSSDPTDPAPAAGACGSAAKMDACYECCEKAAPPSAIELLQKSFGDCMCAADKCGTQCAQSACVDKEPTQGDACDTCIQAQFEACDTAAATACEANADCKKLFDCEDSSKCADKPE